MTPSKIRKVNRILLKQNSIFFLFKHNDKISTVVKAVAAFGSVIFYLTPSLGLRNTICFSGVYPACPVKCRNYFIGVRYESYLIGAALGSNCNFLLSAFGGYPIGT